MTAARLRIYAYLFYMVSVVGAYLASSDTGWEFWLPFALGLLFQLDAMRRD